MPHAKTPPESPTSTPTTNLPFRPKVPQPPTHENASSDGPLDRPDAHLEDPPTTSPFPSTPPKPQTPAGQASTSASPTSPSPRNHHQYAETRLSASISFLTLHHLPIYKLPAEIFHQILCLIPIDDYPSLVPAFYHLLRAKGITQAIPTPRLQRLLIWPRHGFFDSYANATDVGSKGFIPR